MENGKAAEFLARCDARLLGAAAPLLWLSLAHAHASELFCWSVFGIALGLAAALHMGDAAMARHRKALLGVFGLAAVLPIAPLVLPEAPALPFWLAGGIATGCSLVCWFRATTARELAPVMGTLAAGIVAANLLRAAVLTTGIGVAGDVALFILCAACTLLVPRPKAPAEGESDDTGAGKGGIAHLASVAAPFLLVAAYLGFAHEFPRAILGQGEIALPYALAFACAFCLAICLWFLAELNRWGGRQQLRIAALALSVLVLVALFADRTDKYVLLGLQMSSDDVVAFSIWMAVLATGRDSGDSTKPFCGVATSAFLLEGIGAYIGTLAPVRLFLIGFPHEGIYLFTACAFAAILVGLASVSALLGESAPRDNRHGESPEDAPVETPGTESVAPDPSPGPPRELATLDELCAQLARRHGLTEREAEIVRLLAQGRTRTRIAETLFLSQNTVQWYCRQIYQKLGIHSKQELLSLLGIE